MDLFKTLQHVEIIESVVTCMKLGIGKQTEKPYRLMQLYGQYNVTDTNRHIVAGHMRNALVKYNTMMYRQFGIEDYVGSYFPHWEPMVDATTPGGWVKTEN